MVFLLGMLYQNKNGFLLDFQQCGRFIWFLSTRVQGIINVASHSPVAEQGSSRQLDLIRAPDARLTQQQGDDAYVCFQYIHITPEKPSGSFNRTFPKPIPSLHPLVNISRCMLDLLMASNICTEKRLKLGITKILV